MPMHVRLLEPKEFDTLKEKWNALLSKSRSDTVFLRWEWMHTWWRHFGRNRTLFLIGAESDGELVGLAPFYVDASGPLGARCLRVCSDELSPDYLDLIAEKG